MNFNRDDIALMVPGFKTQVRQPQLPGDELRVTAGGRAYVWRNGRVKWMEGRKYAIQPMPTGRGSRKRVGRFLLKKIRGEALRSMGYLDALAEGIHSSEGVWAVDTYLEKWDRRGYRKPFWVADNPLVWAFDIVYLARD